MKNYFITALVTLSLVACMDSPQVPPQQVQQNNQQPITSTTQTEDETHVHHHYHEDDDSVLEDASEIATGALLGYMAAKSTDSSKKPKQATQVKYVPVPTSSKSSSQVTSKPSAITLKEPSKLQLDLKKEDTKPKIEDLKSKQFTPVNSKPSNKLSPPSSKSGTSSRKR